MIFRVAGSGEELPVFTTRPDTLFGATFFVLAPEHALVPTLTESEEVREYVRHAGARSAVEREKKEKDGVFTGRYAINPVNGEEIPIWVADYVLMEYGTGAIMAVPAHDERDYDFALKYGLPVRTVVRPADGEAPEDGAYSRTPRTRCSSTRTGSTACRRRRRRRRSSTRSPSGARQRRRSATACATGCSRGSATGAARSRSSTASAAGSFRCPTTSCRSCCPTSRSSCRRAARRWRRPRTGSTSTARTAAGRRAARRTRWTPSSTRPGTSSATRIRGTIRSRSRARSPTTGCRSTSTSAASSTRSCTCSMRASSRR